VTSKSRHKRKVQIKLVHQPLNISTTVLAEHLDNLRSLRTSLESVLSEEVLAVFDVLVFLCTSSSPIDAAGGFCRVAPTEGRFVDQNRFATQLQDCVASGDASETATYNNNLIAGKDTRRRHGAV